MPVQTMVKAEAVSSEASDLNGQAPAQLESLQLDVRAALAAAQDAQGNGPVLQDSIAKVTSLMETLVRADSFSSKRMCCPCPASGHDLTCRSHGHILLMPASLLHRT